MVPGGKGLGVARLAGLVVLGSSVGPTGSVAIASPALRPSPGWRRPGKPTYPDRDSPLTIPTERPASTRGAQPALCSLEREKDVGPAPQRPCRGVWTPATGWFQGATEHLGMSISHAGLGIYFYLKSFVFLKFRFNCTPRISLAESGKWAQIVTFREMSMS